jgi:hypothetical protein
MNPLARLVGWFKPGPKTPEEIEAAAEAARLRAEMQTARLSQRSGAGQNYQSGRGSRQ